MSIKQNRQTEQAGQNVLEYAERLLRVEEIRLRALEEKYKAQQERVATLKEMYGLTSTADISEVENIPEKSRFPSRISSTNLKALEAIQQKGESGIRKEALAATAGLTENDPSRDNWIKNFLANYKSKYQFINETEDGRYIATDNCNEYLAKRMQKAAKATRKQNLTSGAEQLEGDATQKM